MPASLREDRRIYTTCVVKEVKALLDCCGFAGSAQLSVGVIARFEVRTGCPREGLAHTIVKHFRPAGRYN
jgi:hypothetical protein